MPSLPHQYLALVIFLFQDYADATEGDSPKKHDDDSTAVVATKQFLEKYLRDGSSFITQVWNQMESDMLTKAVMVKSREKSIATKKGNMKKKKPAGEEESIQIDE